MHAHDDAHSPKNNAVSPPRWSDRLRGAGFEAYWAGGCVRDQLLGRTPKDYDVATNATPEQVRGLFGRRRTLAIGAAFGVIAVIGPRAAGTVEVTTFRRDAAYSDGRHPDSVAFSTAEEDASRRDFTINGLFYDPVAAAGDRLRRRAGGPGRPGASAPSAPPATVLPRTSCGCCGRCGSRPRSALPSTTRPGRRSPKWPPKSTSSAPSGSPSKCGGMLADPSRAAGVRLLLETGLAAEVLPEIVPRDEARRRRLDDTLDLLARLGGECGFPLALAALLYPWVDAVGAAAVCRRWRLSNKETGASLLARRTARRAAGCPDDALVGAPTAAGGRGHRRLACGLWRRRRRPGPKRPRTAVRCWRSPAKSSIRRRC